MFEYDKDAKHAAEVLDKYDFTDILKELYPEEVHDIVYVICNSEITNNEILDAFDNMGYEETAIYFMKRYNIAYVEVHSYKVLLGWKHKWTKQRKE